jgi:putative flippase GtrA
MTPGTVAGLVTIGIPTRNRCGYVVEAVRSALAQTYAHIEVIVSDNASTDATVGKLREIGDPRLTVLAQPANLGMVGNFNACLDAAHGEYFLMLSDDDVLEPEAIGALKEPFVSPPSGQRPDSIGMTWCPCTIIDAAGRALWTTQPGPPAEPSLDLVVELYNGNRGPRLCGVMLRTGDMRRVGGYNEERHGALCDNGNWTRAAVAYDCVVCVPRALARYRVHGGSETLTSAVRDWQRFGENIYADLLESLRAAGRQAPRRLAAANRNHIGNITVTILLQTVGRPGWIGAALRECIRSRRYMLTPFVAKRCLRDGWKILRLAGHRPPPFLAKIARHFPPDQFLRYLLVGVWNTVFGYAIFAGLTAALDPYIAQSYLPALVIGSFVSITSAFLCYKWFVFRTKGNYLREWMRCLAVYGSSTLGSLVILPAVVWALRHGAGMGHLAPYAGGAILTCFGVVYNFLGHRSFSFRSAGLADKRQLAQGEGVARGGSTLVSAKL